jgi:hypothetical protein
MREHTPGKIEPRESRNKAETGKYPPSIYDTERNRSANSFENPSRSVPNAHEEYKDVSESGRSPAARESGEHSRTNANKAVPEAGARVQHTQTTQTRVRPPAAPKAQSKSELPPSPSPRSKPTPKRLQKKEDKQ